MSDSPVLDEIDEYDDLLDGGGHRWRGRLIGLAVLAALIAAGAYALWSLALAGGSSTAEETQTATVERGSITTTVSTSGVVVSQSTAEISFSQSGTVSAVKVSIGQEVKKGDVLAKLESDELKRATTEAEVNLASAQVNLSQLLKDPDEAEIASAEQSVAQAQVSLDQAQRALDETLDGPTEVETLSAEQSVTSAEGQVAQAEESRENLYEASGEAIDAAEEAVRMAEDALEDSEGEAEDAARSLQSAESSLKSVETGYCAVDGAPSFCTKRAAPISSADEAVLMEATVTGSKEVAKQASEVLTANTSYENAVASKDSADDAVETAEEDLQEAKDDLEDAQAGPSDEEIASVDAAVVSAQEALDLAIEQLAELSEKPTEDELAEAQGNVDTAAAALVTAQAQLNDLLDGADIEEIELQQNQVRLAELSLEKAEEDLEEAKLVAPFDGTVAALNIEVGESAGGTGETSTEAAIVLNTPDAVSLDLTVTESDVPDIESGQTGIATFDALEDTRLPVVVDSVETNPTTTQGVVTYAVHATIMSADELEALGGNLAGALAGAGGAPTSADIPDAEATPAGGAGVMPDFSESVAELLPGMNTSVTITVDQAQDVLMVSTSAVQTMRGGSYVDVLMEDGSTQSVEVEAGLSDGTNTEIVRGLEEGQTILLPSRSSTSTSSTTEQEGGEPGFPDGFSPGQGQGFPGGAAPGGMP